MPPLRGRPSLELLREASNHTGGSPARKCAVTCRASNTSSCTGRPNHDSRKCLRAGANDPTAIITPPSRTYVSITSSTALVVTSNSALGDTTAGKRNTLGRGDGVSSAAFIAEASLPLNVPGVIDTCASVAVRPDTDAGSTTTASFHITISAVDAARGAYRHVFGRPVHTYPVSSVHVAEHPSPPTMLPSSHSSEHPLYPSPQTATVPLIEMPKLLRYVRPLPPVV